MAKESLIFLFINELDDEQNAHESHDVADELYINLIFFCKFYSSYPNLAKNDTGSYENVPSTIDS